MPRQSAREPVQEFFSIGDVCALTELKPHVLRYWESQFKFLSPAKNRSGNRVYQRREVELIQLVKHLLYTEKYTIDGARKKVEEQRRAGADAVGGASRVALDRETLGSLERDLGGIVTILAGEGSTPRPAWETASETPARSRTSSSKRCSRTTSWT